MYREFKEAWSSSSVMRGENINTFFFPPKKKSVMFVVCVCVVCGVCGGNQSCL